MKFSILTPVRNGSGKIGRTVDSVLSQTALRSGNCTLSYTILDAGSTDDTVQEAKRVGGESIEIRSRPDHGMFDALGRELPQVDGDVVAWINAGETYDDRAFQIVSEVLAKFPEVDWLTGRATVRNKDREIIDSPLPHPFYRRFMDCGMYGTRLPFLMQEATFWKPDLHRLVDFDKLRTVKLAGDYYLWRSFARGADVYVVNAHLASFTVEPGQLSHKNPGEYVNELKELRRQPTIAEQAAAVAWNRLTRKRIPRKRARRFIHFHIKEDAWVMKSRNRRARNSVTR